MRHIVMGTAGHIDHGKTTLVKALTGVDTDRLKEEKERGITTDLGFASMSLSGGLSIGIIDVPGHERFVKNMVAGASGIDMVMLVIAADDGVMPQTREHLDICSLLGIRRGLVAVTKSDLVDEDLLLVCLEEISGFLKGTFLEGNPIIPVSATNGKGMDELKDAISRSAGGVLERKSEGVFRMPVDRSFSMKGFGTVVTGTIISGKVKVGDEVEVLPRSAVSRIRGMQIHGAQVEEALAGSRTAINLQGIDRDRVKRGDTITSPGILQASTVIEAELSLLPSAPRALRDGAEIMFHIGAASAQSAITLLEGREIRPGEKGLARIRTGNPVVTMHGDRFILRSPDAGTLGGGIVLDISPPKRKRTEALAELKALTSDDLTGRSLVFISRAGSEGTTTKSISLKLNATSRGINEAISPLLKSGEVIKGDDRLFSASAIASLKTSILKELTSFHKREPMKEGVLKEEVRTRMGVQGRPLGIALDRLARDGSVAVNGEILRLASHKVSGDETKTRIAAVYMEAGLNPPTMAELTERLKIREREALDLLNLLVREGRLVRVKELYFSKDAVDGVQSRIVDFFKTKGEMTPVEFKEMTGLSRKFAIPLLEYLDSQKVTIRVGDVRKLRKG